MMKSYQIIVVNGLHLEVGFTSDKSRDMFGTGDSPSMLEIEIHEVMIDGHDIKSVLSEGVLLSIENELRSKYV